MNWEALGTLAEIIGAIAVLVTLIYLSIQTRLTRLAAEETSKYASQQALNDVVSMYSQWRGTILTTTDVAEVLVKAKGASELTEKEKLVFATYFHELFFVSVSAYRSAFSIYLSQNERHFRTTYPEPSAITRIHAPIAMWTWISSQHSIE